ncbi:MAG: tetratricopeptide repeat protein [Armatimonadetes bacterium]|nr:tetratricopeptide repeat protein [Armatimonadota bacterium]
MDARSAKTVLAALTFFFLSGISGLVYEILWTRCLTLTFGHTVFAVSTVLTAYMAGLALGSLVGGRISDRLFARKATSGRFLRIYGLLELFVGIWAVLSLPLLSLVEGGYLALSRAGWSGTQLHLACFVGAVLALLPPTIAMGATLPVMSRVLVAVETEVGKLLSRIYAVNTLGAFVGAVLGGFVLLPTLGLTISLLVAAAANVAIAVGAVRIGGETAGRLLEDPSWEASAEKPAAPRPVVPLAFFLSGAASMACQVGWTRGLILSLGSSVYAFSAIVAVFLAGLGLGSLLYPRLMRRAPRLLDLAWLQILIGAACAATIPALGVLPGVLGALFPLVQHSFPLVVTLEAGIAGGLLFVPTLLMGLGFPLATHLYSRSIGCLGRDVGEVYGANTLGCIVGSFATGFLLIPHLGAQTSLRVAATVSLCAGLLVLSRWRRPEGTRAGLVWATAAVAALGLGMAWGVPRWDPALISSGVAIYGAPSARVPPPIFYRDGISSTVSLHLLGDNGLALRVNGKTDASTLRSDMLTQRLLGYLPALLHEKPESALVIGLGSGLTVDALRTVPGVREVDCAELEPAVVEAQGFWVAYSNEVLKDPRVRVHLTDGRTFTLGAARTYDVIANEPSNPWIAGVGSLFSRDFYQGCKSRLNPGGVMAQWLQLYGMSEDDVGMVLRSFYDVFPHGSVWYAHGSDLLVVGSPSPLKVDLARLRARVSSSREIERHFWEIGIGHPDELLGHFMLTREEALAAYPDAPLNTDDRPLLEFSAPQSLYRKDTVERNFRRLMSARTGLPPGVPDSLLWRAASAWTEIGPREYVERLLKDGKAPWAPFLRGRLEACRGQVDAAARAFAEGIASAMPGPSTVAAWWAELELGRHDYKRAEALYRKALEAPPPGSEEYLWTGLGRALSGAGQADAAIRAFTEAVKAFGSSQARTELGVAYYQAGRLEDARKCFEEAARLNPLDATARAGLGNVALREERWKDAVAAYERSLALRLDDAATLVNYAAAQVRLGHVDRAVAAYRQLLEYYPDNPQALRALSQLSGH